MGLRYLLHYLLWSKNFPYFHYALLAALHTATVQNFQRRLQGISMQCCEMHFCVFLLVIRTYKLCVNTVRTRFSLWWCIPLSFFLGCSAV